MTVTVKRLMAAGCTLSAALALAACGGGGGAPAATTSATPPDVAVSPAPGAGAAAAAPVDGAAVAVPDELGTLVGFDAFERPRDPFKPLHPTDDGSAGAQGGGALPVPPGAKPSAPADPTPAPKPDPAPTTTPLPAIPPMAPLPPLPPLADPSTPVTPTDPGQPAPADPGQTDPNPPVSSEPIQSARVRLNGSVRVVGKGTKLPTQAPIMVVDHFTKKAVVLRLLSGRFADGKDTIAVEQGDKITLQNATTDEQFVVTVVKLLTTAPPEPVTDDAGTGASTGAAGSDATASPDAGATPAAP